MAKVLGPKNVPRRPKESILFPKLRNVISEQQFITRWRNNKVPKFFSPKLTKGRFKLKKNEPPDVAK